MAQESKRPAAVFRDHEVHVAQNLYCPQGDVIEVADGRCHYVENTFHEQAV